MRIFVAAWVGSTNLGDEMIFASLARRLHARGAEVSTVSVDPARTLALHAPAVTTVSSHRSPWTVAREIHRADALILGGGGLLQDETSQWNLPYHLCRPLFARLVRTPVWGLGLGAGPLRTAFSRWLVRRALSAAVDVTVRDAESAELLESAGVERPRLAADLALALPTPEHEVQERIVVSLRPWTGGGLGPAAARRHRALPGFVTAVAGALHHARRRTGLGSHFVALQADRDHPLHQRVAERLDELGTPSTLVAPTTPTQALAEIGSGRVVVAMRYHAGIAALLAGRPAALIGYSPKVESLAADLGAAGRILPLDPEALERSLAEAVEEVLPHAAAALEARDVLRRREAENERLLERIFES